MGLVNGRKARLFVAAELSVTAKKELLRIIAILRPSFQGVKWVSPRTLHVTLKFLGGTHEDDVSSIEKALELMCSRQRSFDVKLGKIRSFPDSGAPRVIWLGFSSGDKELSNLAGEVEKALVFSGCENRARRFIPHITIGRVKSREKFSFPGEFAPGVISTSVLSRIDRITLFKSFLYSGGAVHVPLRSFSFPDTG
jgi:RNA 2',3'-cyclic 3'-phosphodiesterase